MQQTMLAGFKQLPPLYQKSATGKIYTWSIEVIEDNKKVYIQTNYGQLDGKITTSGIIGDNQYDNFVELIKGLQGFDIKIDEFYW